MELPESSGYPTEIHTFTKLPQCTKCAEFEPGYEYITSGTSLVGQHTVIGMTNSAEALKLTCRRCGYVWLMECTSERFLS